MKPEWTLKIKEEVEKQYNARFLRVVNYLEWLANVVVVEGYLLCCQRPERGTNVILRATGHAYAQI